MSTRAQRRAARLNSEKSTGPRTEAGKSASGLNALRHGLCSQKALLPGEDAEALADLSREFHKSSKAVGPLELYCVERMILCYWRMRRIGAMEVEILQAPAEDDETPNPIATREKRLSLLIRYETSLQRTYDRAFAELRNLQHMRGNTNEPPIAYLIPTIETEIPETGFVSQTTEPVPTQQPEVTLEDAA
jgi:hypothetical protein